MGICSRCFCDPYKLTYISAIVTSIEAVAFAVLNIVFMCMYKCAIAPPSEVALGFDKFWRFYFFDEDSCIKQGHHIPWWATTNNSDYVFALSDDERSLTTPHDNYIYQTTYLGLHTAWIVTGLILIYGNARKKWGYYIPWLLVSTAIMVMDITVSAFCITDLVTVDSKGYKSAMFWILALYFRLFLIFFLNMSEFASAFNAFCKSRHKRSKQARQREKMAKAHQEELQRAEAAAEARAKAQMAEEYQKREQQQQYQHQHQHQGGGVEMRKIPPPVPKKPAAPHELRPFSYLNPAFRPNDPTDVEGMRAHSALPEDLIGGPLSIPSPLAGPYFPSDGYDKTGGFPRRHDSVRADRTQAPHPALRRFSSTRIQPSHPRRPLDPAPDYDFTLKRGPPGAGQQQMPRVNSRAQQPRDGAPHGYPQRPPSYGAPGPSAPPYDPDQGMQRTLYHV
ncbi:uncharacterized protein LOC127003438 [Eriocheir sinensis]|uniref:uncharacterized protein LOC127003438 n=1 Tax=Eriocheir sinensis TaxID=95602 RepID=UPI0021C5C603|nr:uncharacterized protein LOC127003438 [Eriocheir sinensis]